MTESVPRMSLPRLFAEGTVIVLSILLAFAIDAGWESSQERQKEASYLGQLESDLENTLENNALFGGRADSIDWAAARLVSSYYELEPPPLDSVETWLAMSNTYWVVQPRLGTVEALVTSGDIALIRDDSLRSALPNHLARMRAFEGFEADGERLYNAANQQLSKHIDVFRVQVESLPAAIRDSIARADPMASVPSGPLRALPSPDLVAAVRSPQVHQILTLMLNAKRTMSMYRGLMRSESQELLEQVRWAQTQPARGAR